MKSPFISCIIFLTYLIPGIAWSEGTASRAEPDMESLERLSNRISCSYIESSLCRIWSRLNTAQELHDFVRICQSEKSAMELFEETRCESGLHDDLYSKQSLVQLLVSERGTFATIFMDIGKYYRKNGKSDEFAKILNTKDERGLRFLDYLEFTHPGPTGKMSVLRTKEVKRIRRYACVFGGLYAKRAQPSDCRKSDNL